jgi:hypothetical protein
MIISPPFGLNLRAYQPQPAASFNRKIILSKRASANSGSRAGDQTTLHTVATFRMRKP